MLGVLGCAFPKRATFPLSQPFWCSFLLVACYLILRSTSLLRVAVASAGVQFGNAAFQGFQALLQVALKLGCWCWAGLDQQLFDGLGHQAPGCFGAPQPAPAASRPVLPVLRSSWTEAGFTGLPGALKPLVLHKLPSPFWDSRRRARGPIRGPTKLIETCGIAEKSVQDTDQ